MRSVVCLLLVLGQLVTVQAQYKVIVRISSLPASPPAEQIFMAGDFNGWDPADPNSRLVRGAQSLFFFEGSNVPEGTYSFKFTRGSWETVETNFKGDPINNRSITIQSDTLVSLVIEGWHDAKGGSPAKPVTTAGRHVKWLDTAFVMPQLARNRRIWIYLPEDYTTSATRYPVIYLQDGQNLFDAATSFAGEWGVDETLDSASRKYIVVGIDNGGSRRMNEYNPNDHDRFGKGEGKEYLAFVARTLKPYVDKHYRTRKDARYTAIAGSSMGGLISFYAGLYYPEVFGNIGVFSPSFWLVPSLETTLDQQAKSRTVKKQRYYFYGGKLEGQEMVPDIYKIANRMQAITGQQYPIVISDSGKHNEAAWRVEFPKFIEWLGRGE